MKEQGARVIVIANTIGVENAQQQKTDRTRKKKGKGGIAVALFLLAAAAGTGAVLYFTGDAYQIKKSVKLAEECIIEGDYEEAYGLWVTSLLSEEDDDGARAVLDEVVLEKERARIEQAQAGDILQTQVPEERERGTGAFAVCSPGQR